MKNVSSTNTKNEILKAYEELLNNFKKEREQNTALKHEFEQKRKIVADTVADNINKENGSTQNVQTLRSILNDQLEKIDQGILKEQARFDQLQKAIAIENKTLEDLYKVKIEAESLEALIIINKQAKEKLEKELSEEKAINFKLVEEEKNKWNKEKEEYTYNLRIKHRNEEDDYQQKKVAQEKELKEKKEEFEKAIVVREKAVSDQEKDIEKLRKEASQFENILKTSVQETEASVTASLTKEFEYRQKLETKDLESNIQLHKQEIEGLRAKIKEQSVLIDSLISKTDSATHQVKDIALKAIENAGIKNLNLSQLEHSKENKE